MSFVTVLSFRFFFASRRRHTRCALVTGVQTCALPISGMIGRQLPFFSVIVPSWLIWAFAGRRGTMEVWSALLVAGLSFAIPQYLVSNFHGPWLVDVVAAICSMLALAGFLRLWQPKRIWTSTGKGGEEETPAVQVRPDRKGVE